MKINKELIISKLEEKEHVLNPSQDALSLPILNRIYNKMENGLGFKAIHVNDDLIIDGHHRYISSILADFSLDKVHNYPKPRKWNVYRWNDVCFTEEEWDTENKIRRWNEQDAKYNDISVADVEKMIE